MSRARPGQGAFRLPGVVESVVPTRSNAELLATVAHLWISDGDRVLDVTYGLGKWWDVYRPANLTAHDLALDGVDFRALPEPDGSFDVVAFDPPYIAQGGRDTSTIGPRPPAGPNVKGDAGFLARYGLVDAPRTIPELDELYRAGMKEATRVLAPRGRLLVKTMDFVSSGRFVAQRHTVVELARELGLRQVDEFVHYSGLGPQPECDNRGRPRPQLHSRRAHSFLLVFRLPKGRRP